MNRYLLYLMGLGFALFSSQTFAATEHIPSRMGSPVTIPAATLQAGYLNLDQATIGGPGDARELILAAIANAYSSKGNPPFKAADVDSKNFYCVIHVVKWKTGKQEVDVQNWYIYNGKKAWGQADFTTNKRIFGVKRVALLFIHLNRSSDYSVEYDLDVTSKTAANLQHLFQAGEAFASLAEKAFAPAFGFADATISYVPSDVTIQGYTSITPGSPQLIGDSFVVDNEGTYFWDVSIAVPIRKMSQLELNNTNNTITGNSVDKRSVFAVLDLYPFKRDVKSNALNWWPYGLAGVAVAQQPLHKILVAAGWGPRFAQFYAGVLFAKQQSLNGLSIGSTATPAQQAAATSVGFQPQFAFGINLSVRDVFQAAKGTSSQ